MSDDEMGEYIVLVNEEEQYSLWPSFKSIPSGWHATGPKGSRKECLDWVGVNWTDMTPKSLRRRTDLAAKSSYRS